MIDVKNIQVAYQNLRVFDRLSFEIQTGQKVSIIGTSGKGKSTLLHVLAGFTPIQKGKITIFNKPLNSDNISFIRSKMGWVPQETALQFDSVREMVDMPHTFSANAGSAPTQKEVSAVFQELSLPLEILDKVPIEISGGQRQRLLLASSLLLKKELLLTDEPTSALDEDNRKRITDYVLSQKDLTVVAATHDAYWMEKSDVIIEL